MSAQASSTFWQRPGTKLGWWATGLLAVFLVMSIFNSAVLMQISAPAWMNQSLLPAYGILMILCGLASGVTALIALIRKHERSWLVWLALLPGAMIVFLLLGEFLVPH
jgi:hypothetical protein